MICIPSTTISYYTKNPQCFLHQAVIFDRSSCSKSGFEGIVAFWETLKMFKSIKFKNCLLVISCFYSSVVILDEWNRFERTRKDCPMRSGIEAEMRELWWRSLVNTEAESSVHPKLETLKRKQRFLSPPFSTSNSKALIRKESSKTEGSNEIDYRLIYLRVLFKRIHVTDSSEGASGKRRAVGLNPRSFSIQERIIGRSKTYYSVASAMIYPHVVGVYV